MAADSKVYRLVVLAVKLEEGLRDESAEDDGWRGLGEDGGLLGAKL